MSRIVLPGKIWLVPLMFLLVALPLIGCGSSSTATAPQPGGALPENDSIVECQINAYRDSTKGYPKELEVRVISSQKGDNLMNPTISKVDSVITAVTDEDVSKVIERFL